MVYSDYVLNRILVLHGRGIKAPTIKKILQKEGLSCTRVGIHAFLTRFNHSGCLMRKPGSGRPSKVTTEVKAVIERQMRIDDETTAYQLHSLLVSEGYQISINTILRCRSSLGWTFRGSAYCQMIREENKVKRYEWALKHVNNPFENVIYTDECTVQLEAHRRFCCRKVGETSKPKPRYSN